MATAGLNRMMLWGDYEGRTLESRWLLGRLVNPEGRRAWFEGIGPDGVPVMLSVTEALNDEEELLERLRAAMEIRHPNVVMIREVVLSHLDDVPIVVAAMEMTEENLSDVLRDRLLSAAEGRQVLDAVLAALGAMHAHGLVHKHVDAASVVAIDQTIKLRSDCVQMAGQAFGMAAAEDVRWAARMATHAVTGRFPANENDPVLQLLPESMARAVRRALSGSAGATEVAALAGTRLALLPETMRNATRIEPVSKTMKAVVQEPVAAKEMPGEPVTAPKPEPAVGARGVVKTEAKPTSAPTRVIAMKPAEAQATLFDEPLPNGGDVAMAVGMDDDTGMSRWPRAPYVIAAAIAVVLVTVFTLYGLLSSAPAQQKPSGSGANAQVATPHAVRCPGVSAAIVRAES